MRDKREKKTFIISLHVFFVTNTHSRGLKKPIITISLKKKTKKNITLKIQWINEDIKLLIKIKLSWCF